MMMFLPCLSHSGTTGEKKYLVFILFRPLDIQSKTTYFCSQTFNPITFMIKTNSLFAVNTIQTSFGCPGCGLISWT